VGHRSSSATEVRIVISFLALTAAACASTGPHGTQGNHTENQAVPPATTPQDSPIIKTAAAEAAYKDSAEVVTIGQLVNGRINAPTFAVGTVVTFTGTIERFIYVKSGLIVGLILQDSSSDVLYIRLSTRAIAAQAETPHFLNPSDVVTVWGAWLAAASLNTSSGPTSYPAIVSEVFLSDSVTGTSDSVTGST
jgi:hypothetical protein